jgi:hypothetical protein
MSIQSALRSLPRGRDLGRREDRGGHFKTENRTRIDRIVGLFGFSGSGSVPICAIFRGYGFGFGS